MNVYTMSKDELYELGCELAQRFLQANGMAGPRFRAMRLVDKPQGTYGCGYYSEHHKMVVVHPDACAKPSQGIMRQWSFPGYSIDRTPVGVVAHEIGHYIDHVWNEPSSLVEWADPKIKREAISSYEPNASERWAETLRVFILNPSLLREWRPERYAFVRATGLALAKRSPSNPLRVLQGFGASPAILRAAARKTGTPL